MHLERRFARELRERTRRFNLDTAVDGDIDEDEDTGGGTALLILNWIRV